MNTRTGPPPPPPPPPPAAMRQANPALDELAAGQRMLIGAIAAQLAVGFVLGGAGAGPIVVPVALVAAGVVIAAIVRVAGALGYSRAKQATLALLALLPLVCLIVLLMVNAHATTVLKEAGYRVGFLGAKKQPPQR